MTVEQPEAPDERVHVLDRNCGALRSVLEQLAAEAGDGVDAQRQQGLITAGALSLLDIKGAHRGVFEASEAARGATAGAKDALESLSLQLANLLYQRRHHESDIAACLDARSAYTEADISLLSEDQFRATTGEEWTGKAAGGEHAAMVARLSYEAAARQTLLADLQRTRARKDALAAAVAQKRRFADSLASELGTVVEAAAPLRGSLDAAPAGVELPDRTAELPLPLYILATQLLAAKGEFDTPFTVSIVELQPSSTARSDAAPGDDAAESAEAADADMAEADADASDAEEAGEVAAANGGSGGSETKGGIVAVEAAPAAAEAVSTEPLAVELVLGQASSRLLTITFAYAARKHKVVASGADGDENRALAALDAGSGKAAAAAAKPSPVPAGPHPYKWTQQLAGIDFLAAPSAEGPVPNAVAADGHVLAGLAEHRAGKRASKVLEGLRAAQRSTIAPAAAAK